MAATTPPPGDDTAHLAAELDTVEQAIRNPATLPGQLPDLGPRQQVAYRTLAARPDLVNSVVSAVSPALRPAVKANIEAGVELRALTRPVTSLPAWRIVSPPPAEELLGHYRQAEAEFGVAWQFLAAIHLVETRMGRIRGTSPAGAQGPMQFLPATWARYGRGDINDPGDAILAAGRYLQAHGAPENMAGALYAYNPSRRYVRAITLYASQMIAVDRAYLGYYHWQVYVRTTSGDVLLEEGYGG